MTIFHKNWNYNKVFDVLMSAIVLQALFSYRECPVHSRADCQKYKNKVKNQNLFDYKKNCIQIFLNAIRIHNHK